MEISQTKSAKTIPPRLVLIVGLAGMMVLALEFVPAIHSWNYPFYLFFIFVHEMGHGVAALLTGGSFSHFVVFSGLGGLAYVGGGWPIVVLLAGSFSVATVTTALILLGLDPKLSRLAIGVIGLGTGLLSVRYGLPAMFNDGLGAGLFTVLAGLCFGLLFTAVAWRASIGLVVFVQYLLIFKGIVIMFADTWGIVRVTVPFFGSEIGGDVTALAEMTGIPVFLWGLIWTAIAALMFGAAIWAVWFWQPEANKNRAKPAT